MKEGYILLIEDNEDDELLCIRAFKKSNIKNKIVVVRDGEEAINFLSCKGDFSDRNSSECPEIILLDLKLPKVDGFEVLKFIRSSKETKILPVIILTTSKEESDIAKSYQLGANSFIRKPVDFEQFYRTVNQLGMYWLVLNECCPKL